MLISYTIIREMQKGNGEEAGNLLTKNRNFKVESIL